jgi:hypothetical protein
MTAATALRATAMAVTAAMLAGTVLAGCVTGMPRDRQTWTQYRAELLTKRAAFDLDCPPEQLKSQDLGNEYTKGVSGCNRRAVYLWNHGYATWLLNGAVDGAPTPIADDTKNPTSPPSSTTREDTSGSSGGTTTP